MPEHGEVASTVVVHRLGGNGLENLRLKEEKQVWCLPEYRSSSAGRRVIAAKQMRRAFSDPKRYARLHDATQTVASATVDAIRSAGFDVMPDATLRFPNHGRLIHVDGVAGFSDVNLTRLAQALEIATGC
jgi:hypothetical protein